jgi:hypothetical protein
MKTNYTALMLLTGFASAALAQDLPDFEVADTTSDGKIDRIEAGRVEAIDFASADLNNDGGIDPEEYGRLT